MCYFFDEVILSEKFILFEVRLQAIATAEVAYVDSVRAA